MTQAQLREAGWGQEVGELCVLCVVVCPWEEKLFCRSTLVEVAVFKAFPQLSESHMTDKAASHSLKEVRPPEAGSLGKRRKQPGRERTA